MLYTVVPLERIYNCRTESLLIPSNYSSDIKQETARDEYKDIALPHGSIRTRRDGDNYIIDRMASTDMSDYLNVEYMPGTFVK